MKTIDGNAVRLLLVESDENLGQLLSGYFEAKSYSVDLFSKAQHALESFRSNQYDVCIMELLFPDIDGLELLHLMRSNSNMTPIICLTALADKNDIISAFRAGCDDYLTKPFNIEELLLRVEALLRRTCYDYRKDDGTTQFQIGSYEFDLVRQTLRRGGVEQTLTTKECGLLHQLALHMNQLLTREYALKVVWSEYNVFNARSMDVYITRLRKLLRDDPSVEIMNVRGKGFKLIA